MVVLATVTVVRYLPGQRFAMLSPITFHIARIVIDLAFENIIHAAVVAHPSLLKPEDLDVRPSQISSYTL